MLLLLFLLFQFTSEWQVQTSAVHRLPLSTGLFLLICICIFMKNEAIAEHHKSITCDNLERAFLFLFWFDSIFSFAPKILSSWFVWIFLKPAVFHVNTQQRLVLKKEGRKSQSRRYCFYASICFKWTTTAMVIIISTDFYSDILLLVVYTCYDEN